MIVTALQTKILVAYVGVLFCANLLGGVITVLLESDHVSSTTDTVSVTMTDRQLANLGERLNSLLNTSDTFFQQLVNDVDYQHTYAFGVFNESFPVPIVSFYDNFNVMDYPSPAPADVDTAGTSMYSSFWYKDQDPDTNPNLNKSSLLDNSHGPMVRSNPAYVGMYMGFEDGLWRHFPYRDVGEDLEGDSYVCTDTGVTVTGYDPRCRGWYVLAENSPLTTQFTSPYEDASTGEVLITLARAVTIDSSLAGVVGADISLDAMAEIISAATVLESGYSYLCDNQKQLIVHPDIIDSNIIYTIEELEFEPYMESDIIFFDNLLTQSVFEGEKGQTSFNKGSDTWYVSYGPVPDTPYYLLMVVPEAEVVEPATDVETYADSSINGAITIIIILLVAVLVVGTFFAHHLSRLITGPVIVFTKVLSDIADMKMGNEEMGGSSSNDFDEVDDLRGKISNLFMAIKFSTDAYYKSDYDAALSFLQQVEDMFVVIDQKRALGVVYNNRGNILRKHVGDADGFQSSLVYLEKAIGIMRGYCDKANSDLKEAEQAGNDDAVGELMASIAVFDKILASRLSNLGDCFRVAHRLEEAQKAFHESLDLYQKQEDFQGVLQVKGNVGLLKLDRGDADGALREFMEAHEMADNRFQQDVNYTSVAAVQFSSMNLGAFYYKSACRFPRRSPERMHTVEQALSFFYYALTVCDRVHRTVQMQCLFTLAEIYRHEYDDAGNLAINTLCGMYPEFSKEIASVGGVTNINFLIDVSASMWGSRIKATVSVLLDIINTKMKTGDGLSMDSFAKELNCVVLPTTVGPQNINEIINAVKNLVPSCTVGRTHCYVSLLQMAKKLVAKSPHGPHFIVMLTDGEDNERKTKPEEVKEYFNKHDIKLIVVSVGVDEEKVVSVLRYLSTDPAYYVKAGADSSSITDALKKGFDIAVSAGHVSMEAL